MRWDTKLGNFQDRIKNGTWPASGEQHYRAKLKEWQVIEIKKMIRDGIRNIEIAKHFDITSGNVNNIKRGKNWKSVRIPDGEAGAA